MADYDKLLQVPRATKNRLETVKELLKDYTLIYSIDTNELGVKLSDGTITYFGVVTELEWANILNKPTFAAVATSGAYEDLEVKPDLATVATSGAYADLTGKPDLATVATSGAYADLTGEPNLDLKLDKNFSALQQQTNPLLDDVLVLNRGTTIYKATLGGLLAKVNNEIFKVVNPLPATGEANKIYLVPSSEPETQNTLDEFIWVDNAWEKIGAVSVDLSDYFNKAEINSLLDNKVDKNTNITAGTHTKITYDEKGLVTGGGALVASDIPNLNASKINTGAFDDARIPILAISKVTNLQSSLDNKVDKIVGKGLSTNDYINTDKQSVEKIPTIEQDILDLEIDKIDKNNPIAAGTKTKITYDSKGLVTSGADLAATDIPNLDATKIITGTFGVDRIPILSISKITSLQATLDTIETSKQDKLVAGDNITIDSTTNVISASGVDLNEMAYFDYAGSIYGDKHGLLANAWEHSLTVDPSEISVNSQASNPRGKVQYPNGETEGVIIPQGVPSIGSSAFYGWSSNNQPLVIPNSVTSIDTQAFLGWSSNNQPLVIPNSVTSIDANAFASWSSNNHPLIISNSITSISNGAFGYWSANNQPLVIPDSVTNIETGAFQYWTSNNQPLVISNSVTSIGNYAFRKWTSNNQPLTIPNSVTSIGQYAFEEWSLVQYVEIQAIIPPTLVNADAFYNQNNAPIYVPDDSVDDYKEATNWVSLANRIFPMSDKPDLGDLHENKLNKIWTDITERTVINLTDILVFNRGSNVYKTTVANLLARVDNEIFQVVSALPTSGVANKIYLVPSSDPETQNTLDEFIWVSNAWEMIGSVKAEINSMLDGKQDKLVAGNNITIDPTTNVISASGGGDGFDFDMLGYMNYAADIFYRGGRQSLFASAWEHSLTLAPSDIKKSGYPNGETEGVIIPQGITIIGSNAFSFWEANNQPLVIPNSVTSIHEGAFRSWTSNNHPLVIPDSVTSIGSSAFQNWNSNTHPLVIPSSVTSISGAPFGGWWKVPYVEIQAITPPTLTHSVAFDFGYNKAPIYVPDKSVNAYKTATIWSALADRIFPISDRLDLTDDIADLQESKQDKLVAGDNITIDPTTNVISASGGGFLPDEGTITLNDDDELEATNVAIWRYE